MFDCWVTCPISHKIKKNIMFGVLTNINTSKDIKKLSGVQRWTAVRRF